MGDLSTARINDKLVAGAREATGVEVVAVGSRDRERGEAFAAEHGIARVHGSYDELLADPEVEAVYIPLPNRCTSWSVRAPRPASTCCARSRWRGAPPKRRRPSTPPTAPAGC